MKLMGMVMIVELSSADLCRLSVQEVADLLLDNGKSTVLCKGLVDGEMYTLKMELFVDESVKH